MVFFVTFFWYRFSVGQDLLLLGMVNLKPQLKSEIHYGVVKTLCGGIYMVTYMLIIVVKWVDNLLGNVWRYVGIYVGIPVGIYEIDQEHL